MTLLVKNLEAPKSLYIWEITESLDEITAQFKQVATEGEWIENQQIKYPKRRMEWMIARLMLKKHLGQNASIKYTSNGKPYIPSIDSEISISHSGDFIVLWFHEGVAGVDIEKISTKLDRVKSKFLSEKTIQSLSNSSINEHIAIYWCAKEVLFKIYNKGKIDFKTNLCVPIFSFATKGELATSICINELVVHYWLQYQLIYSRKGDAYMLVWNKGFHPI